ncbi:hypothetical protein E6O75_ATG00059 [Venturia nashicola]|uniref:Uncharacterized protein n=1 Tax=Venturia nashicola TaxID=86259 RepID=A0A4Z1PVT5_9PEZI|nr:hypothetical protein E6O75_ATG00059 [Venturia nashicola]
MSPKEFPFPKGEDASTNSSSTAEAYFRQPVQPVPLVTHIPDPQQILPVVYSPEPQPQPQQNVPAYRPASRQQFRTQPQSTSPTSRSASRQLPRGARQQSFVTAYSPASRQQQYLPDPPPITRTPSPVRQPQYGPEPQQTVEDISPEPQRQSIPTYRPEVLLRILNNVPLSLNDFALLRLNDNPLTLNEDSSTPNTGPSKLHDALLIQNDVLLQPNDAASTRSKQLPPKPNRKGDLQAVNLHHEKDTEQPVLALTQKTNTTVSPAIENRQRTLPAHNPTSQ